MKTNKTLAGLLTLVLAGTASATIVDTYTSGTLNLALPDNNPAGLSLSHTTTTANANLINEVDVTLNLSGGYNGDLYGYLLFQPTGDGSATTSILLNRVGRTGASGYGDATSGFNITLSGDTTQSYANIHSAGGTAGAVVSGTYLADGRAISPTGDFTGVSSTAGLNIMNGNNANGTWTLFLADMSAGDQSTLVSWGLDISVVPEPVTYALGIFGGALALLVLGCRMVKHE